MSHTGPASASVTSSAAAGIVTALVGFTSSFVVILTGLRAVGATDDQAASGLLGLCVVVGASTLWLALRHRVPVTTAWSTPGGAILGTAGASADSFGDAVGAFLVCAVLLVLSGLWPALGRVASAIPTPVAQAMLAGVLLPLCMKAVTGLEESPGAVIPVLVVWLVGTLFLPRWAVPLTFLVAGVVIAVHLVVDDAATVDTAAMLPSLELTAPGFSAGAVVGIALPLYVVTMASQNLPGVAVLKSYGYATPWRDALVTTGLGSAVVAPFGGSSVNLAAISAALSAAPETGVAKNLRWRNAVWSGSTYLVLAVSAAAVVALAASAPAGLLAAVAGVALLGAFTGAVQGAWADARLRLPAAVTFLVAASGATFLGIGAAFWALVAGVVVTVLFRWAEARRAGSAPDHRRRSSR
ncbi:benzoate/H(+) symporter BenE family transporter [Corynebacterium nuruki]|uniref:Benzoate transporter n=1 Tax=Corynebacterium nuruki TaxID=1032851 RepID=A0A3D4SZW3_9CORY|nr:benzoate/H(+) symporter BenE family transporter [Corynebacterium nuruki]HCT14822.1 benzoate transporter [Corynebacterium nuruki]